MKIRPKIQAKRQARAYLEAKGYCVMSMAWVRLQDERTDKLIVEAVPRGVHYAAANKFVFEAETTE